MIRRNNPLNLRAGKSRWIGAKISEEGSFVTFHSVVFGYRAAWKLLGNYHRFYGLHTLKQVINRWAPPSENNTEQYIRNVCLWTGFGGRQHLTESDWPLLVKAMARQECGVLLDDKTIARGFCLYKIIN